MTTVGPGQTRTTTLDMIEGETLTVFSGGNFNTAEPLVRFLNGPGDDEPAFILHAGSMQTLGSAFEFAASFTDPMHVKIENQNGILTTGDSMRALSTISGGTLEIRNIGIWGSIGVGHAIDLDLLTGTATVALTNTGGGSLIYAEEQTAIRFGGGIGNVTNNGTIDGGSDNSGTLITPDADGIQYGVNGIGTVTNQDALTDGIIIGDRHGISAGVGSVLSISNETNTQINGRTGNGIFSEGSATIINAGTIRGSSFNIGDGDGIAIRGLATVTNSGLIRSNGQSPDTGQADVAQAIAIGGGSITNATGGIIGAVRGIHVDNGSGGNSLFQTNIVNYGEINGNSSYAIRFISTFADTITNYGAIYSNRSDGIGILFGNGNNTLRLGPASDINGRIDGQGGTDTLDYSLFGVGGVIANLQTGAASGTGLVGVTNFENVIGSTGDDLITGSNVANILSGLAGSDTLEGLLGNDTYVLGNEAMGIDTITDTGGIDTITSTVTRNLGFAVYSAIENLTLLGNLAGMIGTGNAGANRLDGWMSPVVNTLRGLGGNDIYYINAGDIVEETATGGVDTVYSNASYGLAANVENLSLFGTTVGVNGNGNALNNQMFGDQHTGANILRGLGGNDTYTIGANDTVDETIAGSTGVDTVRAAFSYTLGAGVENLFLLGATVGMIGRGNAGNNGLDGTLSSAANSFQGLGGNDTYVLGAGDVANESVALSAGVDTVMSALSQALGANIENLTLTGGAAVNGTGNVLANKIIGNASNNMITGAGAADTLTGGLGKDTFKYNAATESTTAARDIITDFQDGAGPLDVIDLTNIRPGPIATSLLTYIGAGPVTGAFQVGVRASGADVVVLVNLDGNFATAEMEILLTGTTLASMAAGDFLL